MESKQRNAGIKQDAYHWIKWEREKDWSIAQAYVLSDGDVLWYGCGSDYYNPVDTIGPRIMPPNL